MQTKGEYTPGPWELRGPTQVYGNLQRDQNSTGDRVAVTVTHPDARLIAAAPDLLTSAQFVLQDGLSFEEQGLAMDALRAAIARAKGLPS